MLHEYVSLLTDVTLSCIICRSRNGMELLACSCDGTVAYIDFTLEEIGVPMSQKDMVC